jgi:TonB family protein
VLEKVEVSDTADQSAIRQAIEGTLPELQACNSSSLKGRMIIRIVINADGTVKSATVTTDKIKNAKLKKCVIAAIKKWRFSAPASQKEITAKITLVF